METEKKNSIEKAVHLYNHGHLCSQAILKAYADKCGITEEQAMMLGTCFGTGMNQGRVCGACTGALMVIGLLYGQKEAGIPEQRKCAYEMNARFMTEFSQKCGSYVCRDILGCDVSTEEGLKYARDQHLFTEICPKMVEAAAEILEEILQE